MAILCINTAAKEILRKMLQKRNKRTFCIQQTSPSILSVLEITKLNQAEAPHCRNTQRRAECQAMNYVYESNQQDATMQVNLLFLVSSTCFGRCFRPSSGALDCIYSIWQCSLKLLPAGVSNKHVSGDVFAHHQEHLTVFTVSGSVHPSCCRLVSRINMFRAMFSPIIRST